MKGRKNDFSITFYYRGVRVLFLEYVHDTDKAYNWVSHKGIKWDISIIYERRTRNRLDIVKNYSESPYFSCSFFYQGERVLFLSDVYNVAFAIDWAKGKYINFDYVNVYNRHTRDFIEKIYV